MGQLAVNDTNDRAQEFFATVISWVFGKRMVHMVPWFKSLPTSQGRPSSRKVIYTSWRDLVAPTARRGDQLHVTSDIDPEQLATEAAHQLQLANPHAPWTANDIHICDLPKIFHKRLFPSDWVISSLNLKEGDATQQTYQWVESILDLGTPLHQLAMIIGLLYSKMWPNIDIDLQPLNTVSLAELEGRIRQAPWILRTQAPKKQSRHVIGRMMATVIIALYSPESPIRTQSAMKRRGPAESLGDIWSKLHSK
jgi:hypothetical protein